MMETPTIIVVVFIAAASIAMLIQVITEMKRQKSSEAYSRVKLNRLLKYRDKAKLLDEYMNTGMTRPEMIKRYYSIEQKDE